MILNTMEIIYFSRQRLLVQKEARNLHIETQSTLFHSRTFRNYKIMVLMYEMKAINLRFDNAKLMYEKNAMDLHFSDDQYAFKS